MKAEPKSPDSASISSEPSASPPVSDLQRVVDESKENILNAEVPPVKRGRGRPKGSTNKVAGEPKVGESPVSDSSSSNAGATASIGVEPIATLIKLPFSLRARKTGFVGYRIDDPTATELARAWDQAIAPFIPQINSKWGALGMACASTVMVILAKEMELQDYREERGLNKKEKKIEPEKNAGEETTTEAAKDLVNESNLPPISAAQFIPSHPNQ